MAALTRNQQIFRDQFARETGLDRRFVGAWMLAEQNGSAAKNYDRRGYNNWLNIGNTDTLVASGGSFKSNVWGDPRSAAKASADWMRGRGPVSKSYGRPAAGITRILSTAGKGAEAQIQALVKSGWASSGYNGGSVLRSLMGQTQGGGRDTSTGSASPGGRTVTVPGAVRTVQTTTPTFDQAGYEKAAKGMQLRQILEGWSGGGPQMRFLASVLPDSVDPAQFQGTKTTSRTVRDPATTVRRPAAGQQAGGSSATGGVLPGLKGRGGTLKELFYDPQGGWKNQQSIGAIGNHSNHVHVAGSGPKATRALGKLAEQMGLTVRENEYWDHVDPVHTTNSNHYRFGGRGAIDVSGDASKMAAYARRVRRIYGLK